MNDDETQAPIYLAPVDRNDETEAPIYAASPQIADGDAIAIPTGIRRVARSEPAPTCAARTERPAPGATKRAEPAPGAMDAEACAGLADLAAALDEYARALARTAVTLPALAWVPPELARDLATTLKKRAAARRGLQRDLLRYVDVYPTPPVLGQRPTQQAVHLCWREARRALHKGDLPALLRALSSAERALDHRHQALASASVGLPLGSLLAISARVSHDPLSLGRAAAA